MRTVHIILIILLVLLVFGGGGYLSFGCASTQSSLNDNNSILPKIMDAGNEETDAHYNEKE